KLHHQWRFWHGTKNGMKWFAGHEVDGTIFNLYHHVIPECSIQWNKIIVGLLMPVNRIFIAVNECPPDNNSFKWCYCISKHIGAIGMCSFIILRTWLTLAVSFHQESSKVGNI